MAAKQKKLLIVSVVCGLLATVWSTRECFPVMWAAWSAPSLNGEAVNHPARRLDVQRELQKHFLTYGVYIALDDMMYIEQMLKANPALQSATEKACGTAVFAVWLPLKIYIPIRGAKVIEWCWKPKISQQL